MKRFQSIGSTKPNRCAKNKSKKLIIIQIQTRQNDLYIQGAKSEVGFTHQDHRREHCKTTSSECVLNFV